MPGEARPVCQIPAVKMQSTGQAGPEVNRDIEVLFQTANDLIRCVGKLAVFANQVTSGGFATGEGFGGGGSGGSGPGGTGPQGPGGATPGRPWMFVSSGSNLTLPEGFSGDVYVQPTADINVTLSTAGPGIAPRIYNVAADGSGFDVALKNPATTTIATLQPQQWTDAPSVPDASLLWGYPAALAVWSMGGSLALIGNLAMLTAANGILTATSGNVFEMTLTAAGALVTTDTGLSVPDPD